MRFCLAFPRWAIGARWLPVSMKVAKFVMSRATEEQSTPDASTMASAIRREISSSSSRPTACIASQNRRWSSAGAPIPVNRPAAVPAHQSAKASLEHGATSRPRAASAR